MDVVASVVSADELTAPFSGVRAAVVVVEALAGDVIVGQVVFGDLLRLAWQDASGPRSLQISARRATWSFTSMFDALVPTTVPAELVPMLQRGATSFRERIVRSGDRLRVRASDYSASELTRLDEMLSPV